MSTRRIWLFNGAIAALLVWGVVKFIEGWKEFESTHQIALLETKPDTAGVRATATPAAAGPALNDAWPEIASRNPFSFDRNEVDLVEAKPPVAATPKPVLFGTLLLGNDRLALLGKAGATVRSGPPVKVGETFDGWKVVKIEDKAVVVSSGGAEESLVVGRVPVVRNTEKTASAAPVPAATTAPPATSQPVPAAASPAAPVSEPSETAISNWRPGMPPPPGTRIVTNPFGQRLERDDR
jgi:hypothetical protein